MKSHVRTTPRTYFKNLTGLDRPRYADLPRHFCYLTWQAVQRIPIQNLDCFSYTGNKIKHDSSSTNCQPRRLPKFKLWILGALLARGHYLQTLKCFLQEKLIWRCQDDIETSFPSVYFHIKINCSINAILVLYKIRTNAHFDNGRHFLATYVNFNSPGLREIRLLLISLLSLFSL